MATHSSNLLDAAAESLYRWWKRSPYLGFFLVVGIAGLFLYCFILLWLQHNQIQNLRQELHKRSTLVNVQEEEIQALRETLRELRRDHRSSRSLEKVTATVEVRVKNPTFAADMDPLTNGFVGFGTREGTFLVLPLRQARVWETGNGEVVYHGTFEMDPTDAEKEFTLSFFKRVQFIQISYRLIPSRSEVSGGTLECAINDGINIRFSIPSQRVTAGVINVPGVNPLFQKTLRSAP